MSDSAIDKVLYQQNENISKAANLDIDHVLRMIRVYLYHRQRAARLFLKDRPVLNSTEKKPGHGHDQ